MTGIEIAAIALTALTTVVSVVGSISAGNDAKNIADQNAQNSEINAANAKVTAGSQLAVSEATASRSEEDNRRRIAAAVNNFGANGIDPTSGSPMDVMKDQASEGALDVQIQRWKGFQAAHNSLLQSDQFTTEAGIQTQQGENAQTAGYIAGGTTLLTNAAGAFNQQARLNAYSAGQKVPPV